MKPEKWISLLGLAQRAGKLISGESLVLKEIKSQKAKLVIISADASENTSKKLTDKCTNYEIPFRFVPSRIQLGRAIGKDERVVVAVLEEGFAKKLTSLLAE